MRGGRARTLGLLVALTTGTAGLGGAAVPSAAAMPSVAAAASPLLPSADSFYVPPASLAGYADGAVIRERSVQLTLAGGLPLTGASAYQLLYR
ncbi:MAG TPA: hypothetical protein VG899_10240, partial [Mycobacteriales bacterium]|nr:hypothetical protein [Mycobacteriales bacterium]